jgi:hypothetical protein
MRGALVAATFRLRGCIAAAGALAALLSATVAHADQGRAVLVGTVTEAGTKKPIPDAVVTVTSPSLQGEQVTVTDQSGYYTIQDLPPGTYVLRVDKETYRPYSVLDIGLHADTTIRLNAGILPEALKEDVVIVGKAPTVDIGSTTVGTTITSEFTDRIPVSFPGVKGSMTDSFESVADVVPGVRSDDFGMSFTGTTSPENSYLIDGFSVNNPAFGIIGTPLSMNFIKEVSVIAGGFMPEYGRSTGGVLDAIIKSGSNDFHGSVFSSYAPGGLAGWAKPVVSAGQTIETQRQLDFQGNIGGDVSGPIIKDKLWFYAGFMWARNQYKLTRSLNRTVLDSMGNPVPDAYGGNQTVLIPGTTQDSLARADAYQAVGKLTWEVNKAHRIDLTAIAMPYSSGGNGYYGIDPTTGLPEIGTGNTGSGLEQAQIGPYSAMAHQMKGASGNLMVHWSAKLNEEKARLDTTLAWHNETGGRLPSDGSAVGSLQGLAGLSNVWWTRNSPTLHNITDFESVPGGACNPPAGMPMAVPCPVTQYHSGGPEYINDQQLNSYQARTVATILAEGAGHHVIKAGADVELSTFEMNKGYSGARDYAESSDGTLFYDGRVFGYLTGPDQPVVMNSMHNKTTSLVAGGFVQDSWNILDYVSLNVGLRYDVQELYSGDGALAMNLPNQWSPRAGALFDPTHEGHSKIFINYARYYESVPLDMMDREGTGEPFLQSAHDATTCNPLIASQQTNQCQAATNRVQGAGYPPNSQYNVVGAGKTPIDPNIKAPSDDEFVFGGEYEVFHNGRLGAAYVRRWLNTTVEDMSRDEANTYFYGNPGEGIAKDIPKAERNYDAVTLYLNKVFSDDWLAQASYTISYLRGNYAGLYFPNNAQLDPNMTPYFDLKSLLVNANGPLPDDHTHSIKLFGAKDFQIPGNQVVTTGLAFRAESGGPTSYLGAHPIYGPDNVYILQAGSGTRLPWLYTVDLKLAYGVRVAKSETISLTMDIFNLFNFQDASATDQTYTYSQVTGVTNGGLGNLRNADGTPFDPKTKNPNFGNPVAYQPPRMFRFGLKATF